MYEIGLGIAADAAGLHADAHLSQSVGAIAWQTDIDGPTPSMHAGAGNTACITAKLFVGLWGTIAGYDMKGSAGMNPALQGKELVQQCGINLYGLAATVIAQDVVNLIKCLELVIAIIVIADPKLFTRMGVIKRKGASAIKLFQSCRQSR